MKRIVTLLAVLAALIGIVIVSQNNRDNRMSRGKTVGAAKRELLLPGLDVNNIKKIRIKDKDGEVNLAVVGDKWVVKERNDYPASFDKISRVIMELRDQKIGRGQQLGKTAWGEESVKLNLPGEGDRKGQGMLVDFEDAKGNKIKSLILGGSVESQGGKSSSSPFGNMSDERLVRIPEDSEKDTIWVVSNSFYDLQPKPVEWIDKAFIDVKKLKQIEITAPVAADSWKASRKDEQSAYSFVDAKPGEELDDGKASLNGLLTSSTFTDIVTKDKATADFMKDAVKAKLTTLDGFTYDVQALKKDKDPAKGKDGAEDKYYLTVKVAADIPKARPPVKDEKEDDKKKADEKFAADKKALEEKLAKEKAAEGWVFEVSSSTVGALLKKRSDVLKEKPAAPAAGTPPAPGGAPTPPPAPGAPKTSATPPPAPHAPISVTTPPVSVPPLPKTDAKPAAPKDNPAAPARQPITVTTPPISVPPLPKSEIKPAAPANANPAKPDAPAPPPAEKK